MRVRNQSSVFSLISAFQQNITALFLTHVGRNRKKKKKTFIVFFDNLSHNVSGKKHLGHEIGEEMDHYVCYVLTTLKHMIISKKAFGKTVVE